MFQILKPVSLFILAALMEIGGGYLIWQWLRAGKPIYYGIMGAALMVGYGIMATYQTHDFGKVYATYGGVFIAASLLWAMYFDCFKPNISEILGTFVALIGVGIIYFSKN